MEPAYAPIATIAMPTPGAEPGAAWHAVACAQNPGLVPQWVLANGGVVSASTRDALAELHFAGMADVIHHAARAGGPGYAVLVQLDGAGRLAGCRLAVTPAGIEELAAGRALPGAVALCMGLARLRASLRSPGSAPAPACAAPWPRRRGGTKLRAHQCAALAWMRAREAAAAAGELRVGIGAALPVGAAHHIGMGGNAPGVAICKGPPTTREVGAAGACLFDPPGAGKPTTVAALVAGSGAAGLDALAARARGVCGCELAPTRATLIVAAASSVAHWRERLDASGVSRVVVIETMRGLADVAHEDVAAAGAVVVSDALMASAAYGRRALAALASLADLDHLGSFGDIAWDATLLRGAAARAAEEPPDAPVLELYGWPRLVVDDVHPWPPRAVLRICTGMLWLVTGAPPAPAHYIPWLLPPSVALDASAVDAVAQGLVWRWAPPPPDTAPRHHPWEADEAEEAAARDLGADIGHVALDGVPRMFGEPLTPAAATNAATAACAARRGTMERTADAYEYRAAYATSAGPESDAALRADAARLRRMAADEERMLAYFSTTVGGPCVCPVCQEDTAGAAVVPLCGHGMCEHCAARVVRAMAVPACPACRRPIELAATWCVSAGSGARRAGPRGSRARAIGAAVAAAGPRVVVWVRTRAEAAGLCAALRPGTPCAQVRGTRVQRRAQLRRFAEYHGAERRILVLAAADTHVRPYLGPVSDVVVAADLGPARAAAVALVPVIAPDGAEAAQLHTVGDGARRALARWRECAGREHGEVAARQRAP